MPRGRPKKSRKIPKNITLEEHQVDYLKKNFTSESNFSEKIRKILNLYIKLSEARIINKNLNEDNIKKLVQDIIDEYSRRKVIRNKVVEYRSIFEQLTKHARYFIPKMDDAIEIMVPLMEYYFDMLSGNVRSKDFDLMMKIVKQNNVFDDIEIDPYNRVLVLKGKNPYSLLWYAKIFSLIACYYKNCWAIKEMQMNISKTIIRIEYERGENTAKSLKSVSETFANFRLMIDDSVDNMGIWSALNSYSTFLMDKQYFISALQNEKTNIIPFQNVIKAITMEDNTKTIRNILKFYEKLNLISELAISDSVASFSSHLKEIVVKMITNTFDSLSIRYEFEEIGPLLFKILFF